MSAYLCDDHHLIQLAAWLVRTRPSDLRYMARWVDYPDPDKASAAQLGTWVANILRLENLRSLTARYGDDDGDNMLLMVTPADVVKANLYQPHQVAKSIACYEYQACESCDWTERPAYKICQVMYRELARRLPGWENANWGAPREAA